MKRIIFLIFAFLIIQNLFGDATGDCSSDFSIKKRRLYNFGITAAYLGETIFHPGFITSVEYIPLQNNYSKMLLIGNLGFIVHPYNYSALFFNAEIGYRFTTPLGFMFDLSIGVGYMHLWLYMAQNSSIYERDFSGNVTTAINYGYPGLSPSFSMGIGWDLSKISKAPNSPRLPFDFAQGNGSGQEFGFYWVLLGSNDKISGSRGRCCSLIILICSKYSLYHLQKVSHPERYQVVTRRCS